MTFSVIDHSPTSATDTRGSARRGTATQRAAWKALKKAEPSG